MQDKAALARLRIPRTGRTDAPTDALAIVGEDFAHAGLDWGFDLGGHLFKQASPFFAGIKVGGENEQVPACIYRVACAGTEGDVKLRLTNEQGKRLVSEGACAVFVLIVTVKIHCRP